MTEGELIDRLIHTVMRRHANWESLTDVARVMMNKAVDSCYKDCLAAGFAQAAKDAVTAWNEEYGPPHDYRGKVPA